MRLEARLEGLSEEVGRVKTWLAYVETALARLAADCGEAPQDRHKDRHQATCKGTGGQNGRPDAFAATCPAPPLSPDPAPAAKVRAAAPSRTGIYLLSEDESAALDAALRGGIVSPEEVAAFWKRRGID